MSITVEDVSLAQSGRKMLQTRHKTKFITDSKEFELPASAVEVLAQTLAYIAEGKDVPVIPQPAELTTQQVADFLQVSRPFLVKLLESGEIPFRKVGKHRRVRFEDAISYKQAIDAKRLQTLEKLAAQAQELNLGY